MGLSVNGALDQRSACIANVLVGNDQNTPLLDAMTAGITVVAEYDLLFAVTGADCHVTIDGREVPTWTPVGAKAGQTIEIGANRAGLRKYIAFRGGIDAPMLAGSCAPDSMIGFGTQLSQGDRLTGPVEIPDFRHPIFELPLMRLKIQRPTFDAVPIIDVTDGPDYEEFGETAHILYRNDYQVSPRSNHVGIRLTGTPPTRRVADEVLSRGVPVGAIEVPSEEGLLVLQRGRGVTAGYPVLAVVTAVGLDAIAQIQPGQHLRFRRVTIPEAREASIRRHLHIRDLARTCSELLRAHGIGGTHAHVPTNHRQAA